jgi:DNA-binding NarL/FixJ family response regulator
MKRPLVVVTDLMFQARIADALRALGTEPHVIEGAGALDSALAPPPRAAVIDLHERSLDGLAAVRSAATRGVRVLAFGRHTEPALLRSAREAGAELVVPRSQLVEELPALLRSLLDVTPADRR